MGAMYGKRPLPILAQKGYFMLSNGMFCVYGQMADEGLCVDVYQKCRKAPAFRHGDIRHTLFPRQLGYHLAVYSE